jgi:methylmalonyl-CoA mutase
MGVNTFLSSKGSPTLIPDDVIRAHPVEKEYQIKMLSELHTTQKSEAEKAIKRLKEIAGKGENIFMELMETTKYCSIGQITNALFEIGGQYEENM